MGFLTMRATRVARVAATRATRLDWAALSSKVTSDAGRSEFNLLRSQYGEILKAVDSAPKTTPTINWAHWKAAIKTPGVVEGFEQALSKIDVAPMEDTFSAEVDAKFGAAIEKAHVLADASETRIKELEAQLAELNNAKDWSEVTV